MTEGARRIGWSRVAFGDVVKLCRDRSRDLSADGLERFVGLEHIDPGDLRIRRWGEITDGTTFTTVFRPGQVLFGKRRAYLHKVAVPDFSGVCSGDIYVLEPKSSRLLPELLPFICQTDAFFDYAVGTSAGSLSPRTNWTSLAGYEFPLPPLQEQRRLAEALSTFELVRESYREVKTSIATARDSLLTEWIQRTGDQSFLADAIIESSYGCSTLGLTDGQGIPIIRIPNVLRGELDLADLKWVNITQDEIARYKVHEGDILVVRTNGNPQYVGRCVVVPGMQDTYVYASYLIRLTPDSFKARPQYLAAILNSKPIRRILRKAVRSSAGNYNVNTGGLLGIMIPLPSTRDQDALLRSLASLNGANAHVEARFVAVEAMQKHVQGTLAR